MTARCGAVSQEQQQYFDWLSPHFLITRGFCRTWFTLAGQLFGALPPRPRLPGWDPTVGLPPLLYRGVMIGTVQTAINTGQTIVAER